MKNFWFLVVSALCTVCFGQGPVPVPDPISTPVVTAQITPIQRLGQRLRLCVEIKAEMDAADFAAGDALRHRDSCKVAYESACSNYAQACSDFNDDYFLNPYYYGQMQYYGTLVGISNMQLSMAENALNYALAALTRLQFEYTSKGC